MKCKKSLFRCYWNKCILWALWGYIACRLLFAISFNKNKKIHNVDYNSINDNFILAI